MLLEKIITLANKRVKLQFYAMERSLRATGCNLPILVIPYDDDLFDLPDGCEWWENSELFSWLKENNSHPMTRKYSCLTASNYQYVDTDICFLRNPEDVLKPYDGFITSCGHWRSIEHVATQNLIEILSKKTTLWQLHLFNAGQFACDVRLYSTKDLIEITKREKYFDTCINFPFHDQPGMNLLVHSTDVKILNLTLPPTYMESTWAGDYKNNYEQFWQDETRKPYIIHWAGTKPGLKKLKIDEVFFNYLNEKEKYDWFQSLNVKDNQIKDFITNKLNKVRKIKNNLNKILNDS